MSLDVSDAIALAKDLLKTSGEFRAHDRDLAEQFAGRAFEICDDLGIDRSVIDDGSTPPVDEPADDDTESAVVEMTPVPVEVIDDETQESNQQLRNLLQQQARVLQNVRETEGKEAPKAERWSSFKLFGKSDNRPLAGLQSASA